MKQQEVKRCSKFAAMAFSVAATIAPTVNARDYYLLADADGDAEQTSSLSGAGSSQGWSTTEGGVRELAGITVDGDYHVTPNESCRTVRTPADTIWALRAGATLTVEENAHLTVKSMIVNGALTLDSLFLRANSEFVVKADTVLAATASGNLNYLKGTWTCDEGAVIRLQPGSERRALILEAAITGPGVINVEAGAAIKDDGLVTRVNSDLSDFSGDLAVYGVDGAVNHTLELASALAIPQNPVAPNLAHVVVSNSATLKVDVDWMSGSRRNWQFGNGTDAGAKPKIDVAEGATVSILGTVDAPQGFIKCGLGSLVLVGDYSESFKASVFVSEGSVRYLTDCIFVRGTPVERPGVDPSYGEYTSVTEGSSITFSCSHADCIGYRLVARDGVTVLASGTGNSCSFVYDRERHNGAVFTWIYLTQRNLQIGCLGKGGSVTGAKSGTYDMMESFTVTAVPDEGYVFGYWVGNLAMSQLHRNATTTFDMSEDRYVSAVFFPAGTVIPYLKGSDGYGGSSLDGNGTVGWSDGTKKPVTGKRYLLDCENGSGYEARTASKAGTFIGSSLVLAGGVIKLKTPNNSTYTIPNLEAVGSSTIHAAVGGNTFNLAGVSWTIFAGCKLTLACGMETASLPYTSNIHVASGTISGDGTLEILDITPEGVARDGLEKGVSGTRLACDLSNFRGRICGHFGENKNIGNQMLYNYIEFANAASIPADPEELDPESILIENGGWLKFNDSTVIPHNRGITLKPGKYPSQYYNLPTLYVPAGKTLEIKSPLIAKDGFRVMGGGTVVLRKYDGVNKRLVSCKDADGKDSGFVLYQREHLSIILR